MTVGCATVANVTNLSEESCRMSFTRQLSVMLTQEGEKPEIADALASKTVSTLTTYDLGPRPFAIAAPSGTDYRFFIDHKGADCVLTLFGRRKGFVSYTNNLTYIATESLPGCACAE
jgi:hypothetical protein